MVLAGLCTVYFLISLYNMITKLNQLINKYCCYVSELYTVTHKRDQILGNGSKSHLNIAYHFVY